MVINHQSGGLLGEVCSLRRMGQKLDRWPSWDTRAIRLAADFTRHRPHLIVWTVLPISNAPACKMAGSLLNQVEIQPKKMKRLMVDGVIASALALANHFECLNGASPRASFDHAGVRYLLVGEPAARFHDGEPRPVGCLECWIDPRPANLRRVALALAALDAPLTETQQQRLAEPGTLLRLAAT